jgi:hypothetical protein
MTTDYQQSSADSADNARPEAPSLQRLGGATDPRPPLCRDVERIHSLPISLPFVIQQGQGLGKNDRIIRVACF